MSRLDHATKMVALDRKPSPMTDVPTGDPPVYDALAQGKELLRSVRAGALATLVPGNAFPFASLVNVATAPDGSPILLLSRLAAHTRHLASDPRLSLLLVQTGAGDPLAHPRLTIMGSGECVIDPDGRAALKARFLARHPESALYADFGDFSFWRVAMDEAHLTGGFGRQGHFKAESFATSLDGAEALVAAEAQALSELNRAPSRRSRSACDRACGRTGWAMAGNRDRSRRHRSRLRRSNRPHHTFLGPFVVLRTSARHCLNSSRPRGEPRTAWHRMTLEATAPTRRPWLIQRVNRPASRQVGFERNPGLPRTLPYCKRYFFRRNGNQAKKAPRANWERADARRPNTQKRSLGRTPGGSSA